MMRTTWARVLSVPLVALGCEAPAPGRSAPAAPPSAPPPAASPPSTSGALLPLASAEHRWTFEVRSSTSLPAGWHAASGRWEITGGGTLRQLAENGRPVFNVLLTSSRFRDLTARVRLRALSGVIDRGGGLVWRATDAKNHYLARYNPLEKNFRFYTVKAGVRTELASADVELAPDGWHTLEVSMTGDRFQGRIDGKQYLDHRDSTFGSAGAVGLWTKADAVTEFDDLVLR